MKKGDLVVVWRDNGDALLTTIRSEIDDERNPGLIWVHGIASCYASSHVRPVTVYPTADKVMADRESQRRDDFGPNGEATTPGFFKPTH